jgi:hypothetical protein
MNSITTLAAWAFGIISSGSILLQGYSPHIFFKQADIISQLRSPLSANASVLLPGSEDFKNAATMWQRYREPKICVVVEVANEHDVLGLMLEGGHGVFGKARMAF